MKKVIIIGGYGNFGKRIAQSISGNQIQLVITGRNLEKAQKVCNELTTGHSNILCDVAKLDCTSSDFSSALRNLSPDIVIHTGGPFQGQDYKVPHACIAANSHYIDLADDRRYVCDIKILDMAAKNKNVCVISGASSVPGLSSVIVDEFSNQFSQLDSIDIAIAPGNKAQRGLATLKGILSYTGHSFKGYQHGQWRDIYGWMDSQKRDFGDVIGTRLLANIDVPDLELFVSRYANLQTVTFQAGLELPILHYSMVSMAYLAKKKVVNNWALFSQAIYHLSKAFDLFGTDIGGMQILLKGIGLEGKSKAIRWVLYAKDGIGPYIPTFSTCIIAHKLIQGEAVAVGARPCLGMYTLKEFDSYAKPFGIYHKTEVIDG